jgi:hypothetical protein
MKRQLPLILIVVAFLGMSRRTYAEPQLLLPNNPAGDSCLQIVCRSAQDFEKCDARSRAKVAEIEVVVGWRHHFAAWQTPRVLAILRRSTTITHGRVQQFNAA